MLNRSIKVEQASCKLEAYFYDVVKKAQNADAETRGGPISKEMSRNQGFKSTKNMSTFSEWPNMKKIRK